MNADGTHEAIRVDDLGSAFLQPGYVLNDRYTIIGKLGHGGFAAVYEARDAVIRRVVAIKVLNLQVAGGWDTEDSANLLQRFEIEAEAAAQIVHPNTVTIFDRGVIKGRGQPFIAMERLYGHDLDDELKSSGPMSPQRIHALFVGALSALAMAHSKGVIHRDLKPSNLFISNPGGSNERMRLVDFGIARLTSQEEGLTKAGEMFGTPHYMAPEVIEGGAVTPALDVYQMGLILVEMYTGRRVVNKGAPIACAMVHTTGRLEIPASLLQSALGPVLIKALALEPEERYADAGEFLAALRALDVRNLPTQVSRRLISLGDCLGGESPTLVLGEMSDLEPKKSKRGLVLGGIAAAVLIGGAAAFALMSPPEAPVEPTPAPKPSDRVVIGGAKPKPKPEPPKPVVAPVAQVISITVNTSPEDALIRSGGEDGRLLGEGSYTLHFPSPEAAAREITVTLRGYNTRTLLVGPDSPLDVEVRLEPQRTKKKPKVRRPSKGRKTPKPPKTDPKPKPPENTGATILD